MKERAALWLGSPGGIKLVLLEFGYATSLLHRRKVGWIEKQTFFLAARKYWVGQLARQGGCFLTA